MFRETFTYYSLHTLRKLLLGISDRGAAKLGGWIGAWVFRYLPVRKHEALDHLAKAFPNRSEPYYTRLLRNTYWYFGQIFVDILRIEGLNLERLVTVENGECLDEAAKKGKGVILLSGHFGNWEIIPVWFAQNGHRFYPVVRRQTNRGADRFFMEIRRRTGTFPLYTSSSPRDMIRILHEGNVLGLASDQDARRQGVFVNFFGIPSSTPKGAAVFHLKTDSALIMALCRRNSDGTYHLKFEPVPSTTGNGDRVTTITQRFTSYLEREVKKHPGQYFWFHRRWKTKRI